MAKNEVTAKERERLTKAVAREIKRLGMERLANYLTVSRPSVTVMTVPAATFRIFTQDRDASEANRLQFKGKEVLYRGYRIKPAGAEQEAA